MYVGHLAVALAAKGARPQIPLWYLVLVSQAPDWLVVAGGLTGHDLARIERFTESAASFVIVALPLALVYFVFWRDAKSALVVWLVTASHPLLDFFTGTRALLPGGRAVGLNWYHEPVYDFIMETVLLAGAAVVYRRSLSERARRSGAYVLLFGTLTLFQASIGVYLASSKRQGWLSEEIKTGRLFH